MEILNFFSSIVLLIEIFQITFDLLLSLLDADLDFALLLLHLLLLLDLDFGETLIVRDSVMVVNLHCTSLLSRDPLTFHRHCLVAVG